LTLDGILVGSRPTVASLRKLMAMRYVGRAGFRREFLEINKIDSHHITHAVRACPTNEGILLANPSIGF
jgi:hypothetical protein